MSSWPSKRVRRLRRVGALASENSGYATRSFERADGDCVLMVVEGGDRGATDLNGGGDPTDYVVRMWSRDAEVAEDLGVVAEGVSRDCRALINDSSIAFHGEIAAFLVDESRQGNTDLNGDGDSVGSVLRVWQQGNAGATNLGLAVSDEILVGVGQWSP